MGDNTHAYRHTAGRRYNEIHSGSFRNKKGDAVEPHGEASTPALDGAPVRSPLSTARGSASSSGPANTAIATSSSAISISPLPGPSAPSEHAGLSLPEDGPSSGSPSISEVAPSATVQMPCGRGDAVPVGEEEVCAGHVS